jgi:SAM-dependent methyltransferase
MTAHHIDWNEVWKELISVHQDQDRAGNNTSIWDKKENAQRFWKRTQQNPDRTKATIDELPLNADHRVLDVGAGPGRLSIPISKKVAHVTAVEPAASMMDILRENIREYGISNIECVDKKWEHLDVEKDLSGQYDVVIASFSLGMPDIKDAIGKMNQASSGYVFLYWFAGTTPWDQHSLNLWPKLYGKEYTPGPKCDVLYNVLYDMDIYPDVHVFPMEYRNDFTSLEEATEYFESRYPVENEEQKEYLVNYVNEILVKKGDHLVEKGHSTRVRISWKTR